MSHLGSVTLYFPIDSAVAALEAVRAILTGPPIDDATGSVTVITPDGTAITLPTFDEDGIDGEPQTLTEEEIEFDTLVDGQGNGDVNSLVPIYLGLEAGERYLEVRFDCIVSGAVHLLFEPFFEARMAEVAKQGRAVAVVGDFDQSLFVYPDPDRAIELTEEQDPEGFGIGDYREEVGVDAFAEFLIAQIGSTG